MNWQRIYDNIIKKAQDREIDPELSYERHHIVPRSLGGSDEVDNLVALTPREHFLCHALLVKLTEGHDRHKMLYALNAMRMSNRYQNRITSRMYDLFKTALYEVYSQKMLDENPMHNPTHRATHADAMKTRKMVGMTGRKHSEETRRKMSEAQLGQGLSDEAKRKLSTYMKKKTSSDDYVNPMHRPGVREKHLEANRNRNLPHEFTTPWGVFNSTMKAQQAAKKHGIELPNHYIGRLCKNNSKPINMISIARSSFLTEEHLGLTPKDLGFDYRKLDEST
jgi:hypothetical protein